MTDHPPRDAPSPAASPFGVDIFTLFPPMFAGPFDHSILHRAQTRGLLDIAIHDIRDWTHDRHRTADDAPYGGGAGMVMLAAPIVAAVEATLAGRPPSTPVVILTPSGRRFTQRDAERFAAGPGIALICGHYEGIDERVAHVLDAHQISIGDYVLTSGEIAAIAVVDAVCRLRPGVIEAASIADESHTGDRLEYPHFTRPETFRGLPVPAALRSGNHARIARWRRGQSLARTARFRPDLLAREPD